MSGLHSQSINQYFLKKKSPFIMYLVFWYPYSHYLINNFMSQVLFASKEMKAQRTIPTYLVNGRLLIQVICELTQSTPFHTSGPTALDKSCLVSHSKLYEAFHTCNVVIIPESLFYMVPFKENAFSSKRLSNDNVLIVHIRKSIYGQ